MKDFTNDIERCVKVLKNGGTILYPTDTIWGIGCDATNPEAVKKIYELKKRRDEKALIILVAGEKEILQYVAQPDLKVFDYLKTVKKPTTVVYEGAIGLADNLVGEDSSIAIRICKDEFCKHLMNRFKKPIVSTSANISGQPFPKRFSEISEEIKKNVDYIVSYKQSDTTIAEPSALIMWKKGNPIVLRQ
ncbi:MAG: L-threonylcarbamoyladenylate synthase [Chitinophagales bacterium]